MGSTDNKALLQQANAAVAAGDHEGFLSHCTDDIVWEFVGDRTLTGKEAVRRYMRATYVEPPRFAVDHLIADEVFVTAVGTIDLKDESGATTRYAYCDVWRTRDGRLASLKAFVVDLASGDETA